MGGLGNKKIFSRSDLVHVFRTRSRVLVNFRKERENDVCAQATLEVLKSGSWQQSYLLPPRSKWQQVITNLRGMYDW